MDRDNRRCDHQPSAALRSRFVAIINALAPARGRAP
jgi:hypothetical protein